MQDQFVFICLNFKILIPKNKKDKTGLKATFLKRKKSCL